MRPRAARLVRAPVGDRRPTTDQARTLALGPRPHQRPGHRRRIVPVDPLDVPAIRHKPPRDILAETEIRRPVDRDVIVVVQVDQLAEPKVPGQARRLRRNPLHQVTIAADRVGEMINDLEPRPVIGRRQQPLRQRHTYTRRKASPERTRRHFHAHGMPVLRVPRRLRAPLTKALQLIERQIIPAEMQQRVEQHRAVAAAQHEAVAVRPRRRLRVVHEELPPEHTSHHRAAHRHPGVPRVRGLNGVHCQRLDRIDDLRQRFGGKDTRGQGYAGRHCGLTYHARRDPGYAPRSPAPFRPV